MPMLNSRMTDEWLAKMVASNPMAKAPNGNLITCPVRLAFANNLITPQKQTNDDGEERLVYNCTLLFPPGAEQGIATVLWPAWCEAAREANPKNWDAQGQPVGLNWPFHDCRDKPQYTGYTPGLFYVGVSTVHKVSIVDPAMNPIVDPSRVYSGVWAIVGLRTYGYNNKKKGAGFGLQTVMIVAEDEKLAGGGSDPKQDFAHVKITSEFNAAAAFAGAGPAMPPQMPATAVLPPSMPVVAARPPAMPPAMPPAAPDTALAGIIGATVGALIAENLDYDPTE